ncbi:MAG: glycosyltransferase [candidate division Zixibacteria bacterium]|nr:glycosyltransferase [candidate division Zixibacteria bacterium]
MTSDRRSILMIAYYFPPWGMGGVQRPLKLAKYLPEFGWDVTVIAPRPQAYYQSDATLLDELPPSVHVERVSAFDPARWHAARRNKSVNGNVSGPGPASLIRRAREWLRWPDDKILFSLNAARCAQRLAKSRHFDVVWTTSPPPSIHLAGLRLHRQMSWIADFRDPWLVFDNDWGPTPLHAQYARRLRRRIVTNADRVIATSAPMAELLQADGAPRPVVVMPNGYDEADFARGSDPAEPDAPFTILCPGTFSQFADPRPILALARNWKRAHPNVPIRVVHVGLSLGLDLARLAREYGLTDDLDLRGYLDHAAAVRALGLADLIAISVSDLPGLSSSIPGRLFEALRSLRPLLLLAAANTAAAQLARTIPGCWVVDPHDERAALASLAAIRGQPRDVNARGVDSIRQYDRREQARALAALCQDVLAERQRGADR